jgi:hypothetical protein
MSNAFTLRFQTNEGQDKIPLAIYSQSLGTRAGKEGKNIFLFTIYNQSRYI